ncbi:MAG: restriction endonuclease subunit S, partial [Schleiferiaceae bacterium]|nr:restriction endonuclease subunit S [Schleiferiaceae bacterium]
VARWKNEIPLALYNSNLLRLDFDNRVEGSNHFANYHFNSHTGLRQLRSFAIGTTSVAAIYTRDLMKFKFFLPSVEEQQKIASVLSTADREIDKLQAQLAKLQEQKKGLMQVLLTGEVRVNTTESHEKH